jgi:hypothetical protein
MSSCLSAYVALRLLAAQRTVGYYGHVAEIGVFEGRFLLLMTFGLGRGERAIGADTFDWPDVGVEARAAAHLRRYGVAERVRLVKVDSRGAGPDMFVDPSGYGVRFFHVDGDHAAKSLEHDFRTALASCEPWGIVCLDDMLSPAYPELAIVVNDVLHEHAGWQVFCVVDREDIVASAKFLICRSAYMPFYGRVLLECFPDQVWGMEATFSTYRALVLSPCPRLAAISARSG